MIKSLQIENFKSWHETGRIRLAPLTVFFGGNSSGKTSLLQLLLLLKQTVESPDRQRVLHLGDRNTAIDLGTFEDIVFRHDVSRNVQFRFKWDLPESIEFVDHKHNDTSHIIARLAFAASIGQSEDVPPQLHVTEHEFELEEEDGNVIRIGLKPPAERSSRWELVAEGYEPIWNMGRKWPLPAPMRFYGFPNEAVARFQNTDFLSDLNLALENQFRRMDYLGPIRTFPERTYMWAGENPENVGWQGERAIEALLAASHREISGGHGKHYKPFQEVVARWLQQLGLIQEFDVEPIPDYRKIHQVKVRVPESPDRVNLTDVGFGISQVLPIVVQCFYSQPCSTLILEQPELHLHPGVQSGLADLFIEAVQSQERVDGAKVPRRLQLLIESHSEHFLRRLQRRVAEGEIDPKDVAIYFCRRGRGGSRLEELCVDELGNITNWPENFFGDSLEDLTAMAEVGIRRAMEGE